MSVQELDAIQRAGTALSQAVDKLDRDHLRALADRVGILSYTTTEATRISVKRRLVDAGGKVRVDK